MYYGEILSIIVAFTWTLTALCAEVASKRMGQLQMNLLRMAASLVILALLLWAFTGSALPHGMNWRAMTWLLASGAMGYVFGDWCLFTTYELVGSRFGQLMMTLAPLFSALTAWLLLDERLGLQAMAGIVVTMGGIGIVVSPTHSHSRRCRESSRLNASESERPMPPQAKTSGSGATGGVSVLAILFGIGAAAGQGVGIVLSKVGMSLCEQTPLLPMAATMVRAVAGLVCFGAIYIAKGDRARMHAGLHDVTTMHAAAGAIILGPVIGVTLSLLAVQLAPAGIASTLMALTPVFILWPSRRLFGQRISLREVVGSCIAVAGVAIFFL
ncbi:MAG: DMT family transporter [Bacteroidaceae bacterium]|nr:DMT family transporter [Bacteroidaceae bacterium]